MNWSLYTADRATHLKIVVVALIAGTLVAGFGIAARDLNLGTDILTARPMIPFLALGGGAGALAYVFDKRAKVKAQEEAATAAAAAAKTEAMEEPITAALKMDDN